MRIIGIGIRKFFEVNLAIIVTIALLPVFLLAQEVPLYTSLMDYLFNNEG